MRRAAALLLAATALCWVAAPALAAEGDPLTGYWARTGTGLPVPVEPPDPVPEGGTWVAADPSGPAAVSALRTDLPAGLVAVELRLTIADAIGTPAVQACPSADRWVPEQGGRLEAAPLADCAAPLEARVDGEALVVPLPPGLDAVNVLLRPAPGSAFSVTMERATAASVVTAPAPATGVAPVRPPPPPAPTAPLPPGFGSAGLPELALPPAMTPADPLLAAPPLPSAAVPAPAPQAAPAPVAAPGAVSRGGTARNDRPEALLAAAVLALLAVQAVRLARQPAVAPRALGGSARRSRPDAASVPAELVPARGVGRFRTARTRPPVRV